MSDGHDDERDAVPPDGSTTSATDDSSVGLGNRDDALDQVPGPGGGPGEPVGRGGQEPSLQEHHDAETEADTSSGGSAESEADASEERGDG